MRWMIYGANGYAGELIAREAAARGLGPILAGRSEARVAPLAGALGLEHRVFGIDGSAVIAEHLGGVELILHCAGPFSTTSAQMIEACLERKVHYLDISGEISVHEHAHAQDARARAAGIVICPGVGFDVIPTDCVAAALKEAMPDATQLALAFAIRSGLSGGTVKTVIEGMSDGGRVRRDGHIVKVPSAYRTRRIDFGHGAKPAMTLPWGDVSTAFHTTGIPNVEVYFATSPVVIAVVKSSNYLGPILGARPVQAALMALAGRLRGPGAAARARGPTFVWGEARNARGETKTARITTANGYDVTVSGALAVVAHLREFGGVSGHVTPSRLVGASLVTDLPGSGPLTIA